jgi:predicted Rossmann fold nucleotide-binding protein DprA/Smf involved in DNA uptake
MVKKIEEWIINHGPIKEIVSGGAGGADKLAEQYSLQNLKKKATIFKAEWNIYGKRAGPIRNQKIIDLSEALIAFPTKESKGTWITVRMAEQKKIPVTICQSS